MIYYLFFLVYLAAGVLIVGALFAWAVRTRQFRDPERARYLPLEGAPPVVPDASAARWPRSMAITVGLIVFALVVQIVVILAIAL